MSRHRNKLKAFWLVALFIGAFVAIGLIPGSPYTLSVSSKQFPLQIASPFGVCTSVAACIQFDPSSQLYQENGVHCGSAPIGGNSFQQLWCGAAGTETFHNQLLSIGGSGGGQTLTWPEAALGSGSPRGQINGEPCPGTVVYDGACGDAWSVLGGTTNLCTTGGPCASLPWSNPGQTLYGLAGGFNYPWTLVGNDQSFQSVFNEPTPTASSQTLCPYTQVSNGCNPFTLALQTSYGLLMANVYRFEFVLKLTVYGDGLVSATYCVPTNLFNSGLQCPNAETQALNVELSFINNHAKITGTVLVDLSVPDPFSLASSSDRFGDAGAWIAGCPATQPGCSTNGAGGCLISEQGLATGQQPLTYGGSAQITQCLNGPHSLITDKYLPFSNTSIVKEPSISSYTAASASLVNMLNLNSYSQLMFNLANLGPKYTAVISSSQTNTGDCLAASYCTINYDSGIQVQIPMIMDVIGTSPYLAWQSGIIGNLTQNNPNWVNSLGKISVHVQDALSGLPLSGMQVGLGSSGCSALQGPTHQTDPSGNTAFSYLNPGTWFVCAAGGTGTITLLFLKLGIYYSDAQTNIPLQTGGVASAVLPLQPNLYAVFTLFGIVLVLIVVIILVIGFVIKGGSKVTLLGAASSVVGRARKLRG